MRSRSFKALPSMMHSSMLLQSVCVCVCACLCCLCMCEVVCSVCMLTLTSGWHGGGLNKAKRRAGKGGGGTACDKRGTKQTWHVLFLLLVSCLTPYQTPEPAFEPATPLRSIDIAFHKLTTVGFRLWHQDSLRRSTRKTTDLFLSKQSNGIKRSCWEWCSKSPQPSTALPRTSNFSICYILFITLSSALYFLSIVFSKCRFSAFSTLHRITCWSGKTESLSKSQFSLNWNQ